MRAGAPLGSGTCSSCNSLRTSFRFPGFAGLAQSSYEKQLPLEPSPARQVPDMAAEHLAECGPKRFRAGERKISTGVLGRRRGDPGIEEGCHSLLSLMGVKVFPAGGRFGAIGSAVEGDEGACAPTLYTGAPPLRSVT